MIDEKRHHIMKKNQIIAAGRFEYEKGFDLLIQAVYEIQEDLRDFGYTVSIFGDGSEKEALQQQINFYDYKTLSFYDQRHNISVRILQKVRLHVSPHVMKVSA